jgi:hypothetical protein
VAYKAYGSRLDSYVRSAPCFTGQTQPAERQSEMGRVMATNLVTRRRARYRAGKSHQNDPCSPFTRCSRWLTSSTPVTVLAVSVDDVDAACTELAQRGGLVRRSYSWQWLPRRGD